MKPLEHTSALGWIIALSALGWIVGLGVGLLNMNARYTGALLGAGGFAVAGVCFTIMVTALVGRLVLLGTRQMLEQIRSGSSSEGGAPKRAVGDAGVDLRGGDGGVPEESLDGK